MHKQASDPRTITLVQKLIARDTGQLDAMWSKALKTINRHLDSKDSGLVINARRDLLRYATAGDPPLARVDPAHIADESQFTLEELLSTLRRAESGPGSGPGRSQL